MAAGRERGPWTGTPDATALVYELSRPESTPGERRRAALAIAAHADNANDLATLLAMLGISAADLRPPADPPLETGPATALPPECMAELAELADRRRAGAQRPHRRRSV